MKISQSALDELISLIQQANKAIMEVYDSNSTIVEFKSDNSPLTQADKASHEIITTGLRRLFPDIPIISEEGDMDENRANIVQPTYWIVDPIDGTQDFVNRTGEFCIAIGLVDGDKPRFGLVAAPTLDTIYYGGSATKGSFKKQGMAEPEPIHTSRLDPHVVVVSRSHVIEETERYIRQNYPTATKRKLGSMLKQMAIAEGQADIYPVIGQPLNLWDVAAGQAIIEAAGGSVKRIDGSDINWHETSSLKVGDFIAKGF